MYKIQYEEDFFLSQFVCSLLLGVCELTQTDDCQSFLFTSEAKDKKDKFLKMSNYYFTVEITPPPTISTNTEQAGGHPAGQQNRGPDTNRRRNRNRELLREECRGVITWSGGPGSSYIAEGVGPVTG